MHFAKTSLLRTVPNKAGVSLLDISSLGLAFWDICRYLSIPTFMSSHPQSPVSSPVEHVVPQNPGYLGCCFALLVRTCNLSRTWTFCYRKGTLLTALAMASLSRPISPFAAPFTQLFRPNLDQASRCLRQRTCCPEKSAPGYLLHGVRYQL